MAATASAALPDADAPSAPLRVPEARTDVSGISAAYLLACGELQCKPNSGVRRILARLTPPFVLPELDLSRCGVGPKGLLPVVAALRKAAPGLKRICVRGNELTDSSLHALCDSLRLAACSRSTLEQLDISDNPLLRDPTPLYKLAQVCLTLCGVVTDGTQIPDGGVTRALLARVSRNRSAMHAKLRAQGLLPKEGGRPYLDGPQAEALLGASQCIAPGLHVSDPAPPLRQYLGRINRDFCDPDLVPCIAPQMRRLHEFAPRPQMWPDLLSTEALRLTQSGAGLQWFILVLHELARHAEDSLRSLLCPSSYCDHGCYSCRFRIDGEWRYCVIDDQIPCDASGDAFHVEHALNKSALWFHLLLRAVAKRAGGYQSVAFVSSPQSPGQLAADWTGGLCLNRALGSDPDGDLAWWTWVRNAVQRGGHAFATVAPGNATAEKLGLQAGCAYSVREVHAGASLRLLLLSDPFGSPRWSGEWCDGHPSWSCAPGLWRTLRGDEKAPTDFWVDWPSLCATFSTVSAVLPDLGLVPGGCEVRGGWTEHTAGGPPSARSWNTNPCWEMTVKALRETDAGTEAPLSISLQLPDARTATTQPASGVSFQVLREAVGGGVPQRCSPDFLAGMAGPHHGPAAVWEGELRQGVYYVVPTSTVAGECSSFRLCAGPVTAPGQRRRWRVRLRPVDRLRGWLRTEIPEVLVESVPPPRFACWRLPQYELRVAPTQSAEPLELQADLAVDSDDHVSCGLILSTSSQDRLIGTVADSDVFARTDLRTCSVANLRLRLPAGRYLLLPCVGPEGAKAVLRLTLCSRLPGVDVTPVPQLFPAVAPVTRWHLSSGSNDASSACVFALTTESGGELPEDSGLLLQLRARGSASPLVSADVLGRMPGGRYAAKQRLAHAPSQPIETSCTFSTGHAIRTALYIVCTLLPPGSSAVCELTIASEYSDLVLSPCTPLPDQGLGNSSSA
eukprot:TRINITY_DN32226_c0_g1_i1.p1 TRINITY_DN32226_c0_g1~~TRINITY_DN32226_c0_g1_i1.p1  ORF type:complete len:978 (+),score=207.66 TRINITY_DN32226_c0_g1_i1:55-2934(+)